MFVLLKQNKKGPTHLSNSAPLSRMLKNGSRGGEDFASNGVMRPRFSLLYIG